MLNYLSAIIVLWFERSLFLRDILKYSEVKGRGIYTLQVFSKKHEAGCVCVCACVHAYRRESVCGKLLIKSRPMRVYGSYVFLAIFL